MTEPTTLIDRHGRSHRFPPPLERHYPVVDGRVVTRSLEAHVVDHCNLTCAECCSLSPYLPRRLTSPDDLARDLELAAAVLAPTVLKLVGGEPLLHPELPELLRVARAQRIAPRVSLTTNGVLLPRMPDAAWEQLHAITISRYPAPALSEEVVAQVEAKAARFGVELNWKQQDRFVKMSRPDSGGDAEAEAERTAEIYERCWIRERCHLVRDGYLYTCTRPVHFGSLYDVDPRVDGVPLSGASPQGVLAYLLRERPLETCARCAGGDAPMVPHRLLSAQELARGRRAAGGRG
ncbi:MAG: radical SAM protein [Nannocystaceae bacterium]